MDKIKREIIALWLKKCYLRHLGKNYPEQFKRQVYDLTDNKIERKIMMLRYTGDEPLKFEAIAIDLKMDERNVFRYHKNVINLIIDC